MCVCVCVCIKLIALQSSPFATKKKTVMCHYHILVHKRLNEASSLRGCGENRQYSSCVNTLEELLTAVGAELLGCFCRYISP